MRLRRAKRNQERRSGWELWRIMPRTLPYLRPYWKLLAVSFGLLILGAAATMLQPWPLAVMLDEVSGRKNAGGFFLFGAKNEYTVLAIATAAGFFVVILSHGLTVINSYLDSKLEQHIVLDLRSDLFEHAQRLSLTFHDERRTGELMARINYAAGSLGAIIMSVPPIAQSLLTLVGMAVIAALIDLKVALISLSVLPFMYYSLRTYGVRIVPRLERVQTLEWQSLSMVNEAMGMLRVIVPFNREGFEHQKFRDQGAVAADERVRLTVRQTLFNLAVSTATGLGIGLVFFFGFSAHFHNEITIGQLVVLLSYVAAVYTPLEQISNTIGALNQQLIQLHSSFELLDTEPEIRDAPDAQGLSRVRGEIRFDGVDFSYSNRQRVLRGVSFTAEPGSRVAIVGPTGAGKTTLASLLIRFYDPEHGRVTLDGVDLRQLKIAALRQAVSVVPQEPLLFSGSIESNIRYGRLDATSDEVVAAARAANAHDFIVKLPHGYETVVGERGSGLSGGERQRIAVARAFLKDAPILLLDEPTSSIDSKTEEVILDALDRLVAGRTSFTIAHRLSTIMDADLILVMDRGTIVEQGTHDSLLHRRGLYFGLHEAQSRSRRTRADEPSETLRLAADAVRSVP